jgi:hypothetical protein
MPDYPISSSHKIQVATFFRKVHPSEKTAVDFEIAVSNNDANLSLLLMIQTIKER